MLNNLGNATECFQPTSLLIGKVWVPVIHFCALESGQKAALDRINHQGILYRLWSMFIGGSVLSILTKFLLNRSQHVMVDDCRSKLVDVVSGVPQGSILGPLSLIL